MALGVVRDLRSPRSLADPDQAAGYQEHLLAEFALARLAHGVSDGTIRGELAAVVEFLDSVGVWAWEIQPAHADRFLGHAQRDRASETPPRRRLPRPGAALANGAGRVLYCLAR